VIPSVIDDLINRLSSYFRTLRTLSFVYRVFNRIPAARNSTVREVVHVSANELNQTFLRILAQIQQTAFSKEIDLLLKNHLLKSGLQGLTLFLNKMHVGNAILIVVRVGGRLVISNLLSSAKHPFILYQSISPYHIVRRIHPSFQFTRRSEGLGNQRCQVVRECTHCFHYKPLLMSQIMGNLPPDRLNGERQYQVSGVDF